MNRMPDHQPPKAVNGHAQRKPVRPLPFVAFLALVTVFGGITLACWVSGLALPVKIVVTALCVALTLLSCSSGVTLRSSR